MSMVGPFLFKLQNYHTVITIYDKAPYSLKITEQHPLQVLIRDGDILAGCIPQNIFGDMVADYVASMGFVLRPKPSTGEPVPDSKGEMSHNDTVRLLEAILAVANASVKKNGAEAALTIGWFAAICATAKKNILNPRSPFNASSSGTGSSNPAGGFGPEKDIYGNAWDDLPF